MFMEENVKKFRNNWGIVILRYYEIENSGTYIVMQLQNICDYNTICIYSIY